MERRNYEECGPKSELMTLMFIPPSKQKVHNISRSFASKYCGIFVQRKNCGARRNTHF
jgi:hypothetical protein